MASLVSGGGLKVGARMPVVLSVLAAALFFAGLPTLYAELRALSFYAPAERAEALTNLEAVGLSVEIHAAYLLAIGLVLALTCFALAALIFRLRPDEPIARFVALAIALLGATFPGAISSLAILHPALGWIAGVLDSASLAAVLVLFFVFPDGRFVPGWSSWPALLMSAVVLILALLPGLASDAWAEGPYVLVLSAFLLAGALAQVHRYRHVSGPAERQQEKLVVVGLFAALAGYLSFVFLGALLSEGIRPGSVLSLVGNGAATLFMLLVPLSVAGAIMRYRLWDIDFVVNRALVYGALTAGTVGLYALVVGSLGALLGARGDAVAPVLAAALVAVLFAPLRERLQRGADRLMYGERDDPYAAVSRLGRRLEASLAADAVLPTIVRTIREALRLPYAAVALRDGAAGYAVAAEDGKSAASPISWPLVYRHETVGRLLVAPRAGEAALSPADRHLLSDLARQAGVAVHAVRLTEELQGARERLVSAREEERLRLRRDLHDGLGPQLAGLTFGLTAARNLLAGALAGRPDADEMLASLKDQAREAALDVGRLVRGLRPPALDQLGLMGAVREAAGSLTSASGPEVAVQAEALPPLPAAVEVAAYRIAQEALTNVVRHAEAKTCRLRLRLALRAQALELEVEDDGLGLSEGLRTGVGLLSMRERAEELGGTLWVGEGPLGGTRVLARLPLPSEVSAAGGPTGSESREPREGEAESAEERAKEASWSGSASS